MQDVSRKQALIVTGLLALLMLLTRTDHFPDSLNLPDASMAVFFLGGVYARRHWALAVLMVLAVAIDYVAIRYAGVSDYCVTAAYAFLLVSYAVLWYGGYGCARILHALSTRAATVGLWAGAFVFASLSFLVSNGSFYWLSGRIAHPHFVAWLGNAWQWGPLFVVTALCYVAAVTLAVPVIGMLWSHRRLDQAAR